MKGRKKKPTELKLVQGTFRPDRASPCEPQPQPLRDMTPPAEVLAQPHAKAEWEKTLPVLLNMGVITEADYNTFAQYCVATGIFRDGADL